MHITTRHQGRKPPQDAVFTSLFFHHPVFGLVDPTPSIFSKMSPLHSFIVFASVLFPSTYAYVDFGSLTIPMEPLYEPTPRPNQILDHFDLRYEVLPSMITAVAPSVTLAANGTHQTMYSLHYHHYFSRSRQGRGTFDKRGVFSGDPPIATCTPCGGGAVTYTPPTLTSSTASCKTLTYHVSLSLLLCACLVELTASARVSLTILQTLRAFHVTIRTTLALFNQSPPHLPACHAALAFPRPVDRTVPCLPTPVRHLSPQPVVFSDRQPPREAHSVQVARARDCP